MSRLTYKDIKVSGGYNAVDTDEYACVVKLGKLEDLEEQLGCPLECMVAVFKAMQQDYIYCDIGNGMYKLHNFRLDYVDLADDVYFTRSEYHYVLDDDCCIFVKDYKKTWWLREDKSE
jgi:hypothetical protein